ncbi:macrolide 2'-phosphotransferase [Bacillus haynesii]|uniref:macrolide 2'-phosphotransferase n=1 Tax=Bacillus haynesii TaxID=1925021 RepID=UPI00227FFBC7|nr:macrolide 2'-phosphotransferase [Bacillus haynesii]MCY8643266.1 macrolide 2'-phosphotransferase [Bacillus haynesii]
MAIVNGQIEHTLKLAEKHGLRLKRKHAEINESGMDFQVVFAEDEAGKRWVVRKPRRDDVIERAVYEGKVLKLLQNRLPAAVPDWRIHTPELIAYPKLPGVPAAVIDMEIKNYVWNMDHEPPAEAFVKSLAKTLVLLHSIDHKAAEEAGMHVMNPDDVRQSKADQMEWIKRELGVSGELWERWQKWLSDDSYWPEYTAFIHGDLHPPHILIDQHQSIIGLLDWTEAKIADPAKDFLLYETSLGGAETARLIAYYEEEGGRVWPRMKEHITELQAAYGIEIGMFALQTKQEEHLKMALDALGVRQ